MAKRTDISAKPAGKASIGHQLGTPGTNIAGFALMAVRFAISALGAPPEPGVE